MIDKLTVISKDDLRGVGLNQVVYIKTIENGDAAMKQFSIHAADGTLLSVMDNYDMALTTLRMNDLYPVTLH